MLHLREDQNHGWTQRHQNHRREDEKKHRENQLYAHLPRSFLRDLTEANAQIACMRFQGRSEAGSEAVGIDQQIREFTQLHILAAFGEVTQRFGARGVGSQFQLKLCEFRRQVRT